MLQNKCDMGNRLLRSGCLKVVGQKKLYELNKGDIFIYKQSLCTVIISSRYYVLFENEIRQDHPTTKTDQSVIVVKWADYCKANECKGCPNEKNYIYAEFREVK